MKLIKEFKGYSGSKIYLMRTGNEYFVRKKGNIIRNYERLISLKSKDLPVVTILNYEKDVLDLEYVQGLDMESYLKTKDQKNLGKFIIQVVDKLKLTQSKEKDYNQIYKEKLNWIDNLNLSFNSDDLIKKLPKCFNESEYFGDLTLENILFNKNNDFIIIDPATIEYDSWYFDLHKLNQDLTCKWFLRNSKINLDHKLTLLKNQIENEYGKLDNNLTIVMLFRIYKHALTDPLTKKFLDRHIKLLWK